MFYGGFRRVVGLNIVRVGAWDRLHGASVAWWLGARGHCSSGGLFSLGFSVCRLESRYVFFVRV